MKAIVTTSRAANKAAAAIHRNVADLLADVLQDLSPDARRDIETMPGSGGTLEIVSSTDLQSPARLTIRYQPLDGPSRELASVYDPSA